MKSTGNTIILPEKKEGCRETDNLDPDIFPERGPVRAAD